MEHFMRAPRLLDSADFPEGRMLPCFAGLLVSSDSVQQALSGLGVNIKMLHERWTCPTTGAL
jgi:hypothetical protein